MSMPRRIEHEGQLYTVRELAAKLGVSITAMESRIRRQGEISEALFVRGRAKRQGLIFTWKGESLTLGEWAKKLGVSYRTMYSRVDRNLPREQLFHAGKLRRNQNQTRQITFNGETLTIAEWARKLRIAETPLRYRLRKFSVAQALSQPKAPGHVAKLLTWQGKTQSLRVWACELGIKLKTIYKRYNAAWQVADILRPGPIRSGRTRRGRSTFARRPCPKFVKHDTTMVGAARGKPSQD